MEPWISMPKNIPKELEERAEEICRKYDIQRSNSDEDLVKVPRYRCACTKKMIHRHRPVHVLDIYIVRSLDRCKQSCERLLGGVSLEPSKIPRP